MSDIIKCVNCIHILVRHYEVHVFTGDHWAAGTDANMFITMNGTRGDSGRRLLYKCLNNRVKFKRGQVCYSLFVVTYTVIVSKFQTLVGYKKGLEITSHSLFVNSSPDNPHFNKNRNRKVFKMLEH